MSAQIWLWTITGLATTGAIGMSAYSGLSIDYASLLPFAGIFLLLLLGMGMYTRIRPVPAFGILFGTLAATLWSLLMIGFTALAGLGTKAGFIDGLLIKADAAMGFDVPATINWLSNWPTALRLLSLAYQASVPLAIASIVVLCVSSRSQLSWHVSACLCGSGLVCAVTSAFLPAIGAFPALNILPETLAWLPPGSGVYHLSTLEAFRGGHVRQINTSMLNGVVTFPSFHTSMAMTLVHTGLLLRPLRIPLFVLATLVMLSTVPIGGHYYIDIFSSIVLYVFLFSLTVDRAARRWAISRATSFSAPNPAPIR